MSGKRSASLGAVLSPASFWWPEWFQESAWTQHAPFAFWLIGTLEPTTIVELGTHRGFSYFALCQAVVQHGLSCRCFAVDHWRGDEHAGFYGDEIFRLVNEHNAQYSAFSSLVRESFRDAADHFPDGTVDLLHVDGRHFYEDVKGDFEAWAPKLSGRAVVLFHDTSVEEDGFGVHEYWTELTNDKPGFAFLHGHGLGVLGFGEALPPGVVEFLNATRDKEVASIVEATYERLGKSLCSQRALDGLDEQLSLAMQELDQMRDSLSWRLTSPLRTLRNHVSCGKRRRGDV